MRQTLGENALWTEGGGTAEAPDAQEQAQGQGAPGEIGRLSLIPAMQMEGGERTCRTTGTASSRGKGDREALVLCIDLRDLETILKR